jgi:acyl-coenzyme A thioesterase PaaI-like protein
MKRYLPTFMECFGCGAANPHGLHLRFYQEGRQVKTHFTLTKDHQGFQGRVHGGILTTILDETMGWSISIQKKRMCVAAELQVRFVLPVLPYTPLLVSAEMTVDRRKVCESRGEIRDAAGQLYVWAAGKFFLLSVEESQQINTYLTYQEGDKHFLQE